MRLHRRWVARAAVGLGLGVAAIGGVAVQPSEAGPESQQSLYCSNWQDDDFWDRDFIASPGTHNFSNQAQYINSEHPVAFAGDTLLFTVKAPIGTTGEVRIIKGPNDTVVRATRLIPNRLTFTIPLDLMTADFSMVATLEVRHAGRLVVDPDCVGPCRVGSGHPLPQLRPKNAISNTRCALANLGGAIPGVNSYNFTPSATTSASAAEPAKPVSAQSVAPVKVPTVASIVPAITSLPKPPQGDLAEYQPSGESAIAP